MRTRPVHVERDPRDRKCWWVVCDLCGPNPMALMPIPRKRNAEGMARIHGTSKPHAAQVRAAQRYLDATDPGWRGRRRAKGGRRR
jgi:hypothetical protein